MSERKKLTFTVDGESFECPEWSVGDLLAFNADQAKINELQKDPTPQNQSEILNIGIAFIERNTGCNAEQVKAWSPAFYTKVMRAIGDANTPPKAPTAEAPPASSQA